MCTRHWYTPGTKGLRIVGVESHGRPTKRNDNNQVMDIIREDHHLTVPEVGDMLGIGKSDSARSFND